MTHITTPQSQPAASANYMALVTSREGAIAYNIKDLRSMVIQLEPTLSYAIACAGYKVAHKLLYTLLQDTLNRLKARRKAVRLARVLNVQEVRRLRVDVAQCKRLLDEACAAQNNIRRNKLQFEMDIHLSVVRLVRVRWELEKCGM